MGTPRPGQQNALLRGLDPAGDKGNWERVPTTFSRGEILWEAEAPAESLFFPDVGLISHVVVMSDGSTAEAGLVGFEGLTPLPTLFGAATISYRVVAQADTRGVLVDASSGRALFEDGGEFRRRVFAYARSAIAHLTQTTACNRLHAARPRLARWLLMCHDRLGGDTLPLTHEFVGQMLGTDRSLVTVTLGSLADEGVLRQERGQLVILDREALQATACECYAFLRQSFDELFDSPEPG